MQLLAASIVDKVDRFLHAGYVSASPRSLYTDAYPPLGESGPNEGAEPIIQLDLAGALELGEAAPQDGGADAAAGALAGFGSGDSNLLMGALIATGVLAILYVLYRKTDRPAWRTLSAMACAAFFAAILPNCDEGREPLPNDPPWEGVTVRDYVHPEEATLAILHGIIVPGVSNIGQEIETLANIQYEVGIPIKNPTAGMEYALQTYGLDGWGNEFRMERVQNEWSDSTQDYKITSAGADGTFDTTDDISEQFVRTTNNSWGWDRHAFFLVKDNDVKIVFHRFNHNMFEYNREAEAKELTGSNLFDLFLKDDFHEDDEVAILDTMYDEVAEGLDHDPIIMQVF